MTKPARTIASIRPVRRPRPGGVVHRRCSSTTVSPPRAKLTTIVRALTTSLTAVRGCPKIVVTTEMMTCGCASPKDPPPRLFLFDTAPEPGRGALRGSSSEDRAELSDRLATLSTMVTGAAATRRGRGLSGRLGDELAAVSPGGRCCGRVEAAVLIQQAEAVALVGDRLAVRVAEGRAGARLAARLADCTDSARAIGLSSDERMVIAPTGGPALLTGLGLHDHGGRRIRGLPFALWLGRPCDSAALLRAAVLSAGRLYRSSLNVVCPGPEMALSVAGAAARLGVHTTVTDDAAEDALAGKLVQVSPAALSRLCEQIGAARTAEALRAGEPLQPKQRRSPLGGGSGNQLRARAAAQRTALEAAADLEVCERVGIGLGEGTVQAARLRIAHPSASLSELAEHADPPTSKDSIAGRLRRLHVLAEQARA